MDKVLGPTLGTSARVAFRSHSRRSTSLWDSRACSSLLLLTICIPVLHSAFCALSPDRSHRALYLGQRSCPIWSARQGYRLVPSIEKQKSYAKPETMPKKMQIMTRMSLLVRPVQSKRYRELE